MDSFLANKPVRPLALIEGIVATLIWASSFVLIKGAIGQIRPLTLAGLRYFFAGLLLMAFLVLVNRASLILSRRLLVRLLVIGVTSYTIANGAWYVALDTLSATTITLISSLSPLFVLGIGIVGFKERANRRQLLGLLVLLIGTVIFLSPNDIYGSRNGFILAFIGVLSYAYASQVGRELAHYRQVNTLVLTAIPLLFGGLLLLLIAPFFEGLPQMTASGWQTLIVLVFVNTILAYLLYNHALQTITAFEMNTLLNLAPIGTAILAWILLGETLNLTQIVGVMAVLIGVMLVQQQSG